MKPVKFQLPVLYKGAPVDVILSEESIHVNYFGNNIFVKVNNRLVLALLVIAALALVHQISRPVYVQPVNIHDAQVVQVAADPSALSFSMTDLQPLAEDDAIGFFLDYFESAEQKTDMASTNAHFQILKERFLFERQMIMTRYIVAGGVSRVDQLPNETLLEMNQKISQLFKDKILRNLKVEKHVMAFLTDTLKVRKLETALMEQARFNVPASIKLAQAALETAYGQRVIGNNYFGIKDKSGQTPLVETTEYYTAEEVRINKDKIISKKKVTKDGKVLYKCRVRDHFVNYETAWQSFRAHSNFLSQNARYHQLFRNGKNFEAWADEIGSTKYGGVGYATSPVYGELLKKIIKRYHLYLLDY